MRTKVTEPEVTGKTIRTVTSTRNGMDNNGEAGNNREEHKRIMEKKQRSHSKLNGRYGVRMRQSMMDGNTEDKKTMNGRYMLNTEDKKAMNGGYMANTEEKKIMNGRYKLRMKEEQNGRSTRRPQRASANGGQKNRTARANNENDRHTEMKAK